MINVGMLAYWRNQAVVVLELRGFSEACVRLVDSKETKIVKTKDLTQKLESESSLKAPHVFANDNQWDLALERFELIKPLLNKSGRTEEQVKGVADASGKGIATIYRWLNRFEESGLVSSLVRVTREDKGESRLSREVDELIQAQINKYYLVEERPSVLKLFRMIKHECQKCDLPIPNKNTIYARVEQINHREKVKTRMGNKRAREQFDPILGKFPGGKFPNAVIQIDHTPIDLIVVDEIHRLPIGRPFLTIAIDVATKMLAGFRMSLEHPSALSAGLCIAHSILKKDKWLAEMDIDAEWPFYGKMEMIHVDNAKEFRGKMLKRACEQYGIILEHRPKGQPNYGPHVERAFRTFMSECHDIPGTTFSNVKEKLDYDSEGKACMTLGELERWFTLFVVYYYHHIGHRGIDEIPPINLFNRFVHGTEDTAGVGLPFPVEDEETLKLNFTPYEERTIQKDGVVIDKIHYYSPVLRQWIGSIDPNDKKRKRKFIFARDPRDISIVYFLDPITQTYSPVPYLDNTRPRISLWELNAVRKKYKENEIFDVNEDMIFEGIKKMREIEVKAIEKTRLAKQQRANEKRKRRMAARRTDWQKVHAKPKIVKEDENIQEESAENILPFSDIEF